MAQALRCDAYWYSSVFFSRLRFFPRLMPMTTWCYQASTSPQRPCMKQDLLKPARPSTTPTANCASTAARASAPPILDLTTQTECLLMVNHTYLVMPMDDELFRRYIARTVDASGSRKLGTERIEGLTTTKYAFGNDGELDAAGSYWLTSTGVMVRREYNDGVFGQNTHHLEFMTHITFGKQPTGLFEIPAGYKPAT